MDTEGASQKLQNGWITAFDPGYKHFTVAVTMDRKDLTVMDIRLAPPRKKEMFCVWLGRFVQTHDRLGATVLVERPVHRSSASKQATNALVAGCIARGAKVALHSPWKMQSENRDHFEKRGHHHNKKSSVRYIRDQMSAEDFHSLELIASAYMRKYGIEGPVRIHDICDAIMMILYHLRKIKRKEKNPVFLDKLKPPRIRRGKGRDPEQRNVDLIAVD